jgi:hypothetical protein
MQGSSMRHADLETLRASMVDKKIKVMSESCSHNSLWQRTNKKRLNRRRNPGSSVTSEYKRKKTNKLGCMRMQLWTFSCKKNERKLQRADLGSECLTCEESCMQQEERDRARSEDAIFWWPPNRKAAAHLSTGAYLFCVYKPGQSCATEKRKNGRNAAGCHASMHAKPRRRQTPLINRKKQQADAYSLLPRKPSR